MWVNGGLIEFSMGDGWSGRLLPSEVAELPAAFTAAVAEAQEWAGRWDITTGSYSEVGA